MPPLQEYTAIVEHGGFDNARVGGENADRFFPDKESMVKWIDQPSF